MLMPLPICRTEHRESSSLSYPRRALIVLTALTLAAFISGGCQSGPRRNPLRHLLPLRLRLLQSQPPCCRGLQNPRKPPKPIATVAHNPQLLQRLRLPLHLPRRTHPHGCGRTYSEPNSGSYSGADARGWWHTRQMLSMRSRSTASSRRTSISRPRSSPTLIRHPAVLLGRRPKWTLAPPTVLNRSPQ